MPTARRCTSSRRWPTSANAAPPSRRWPRARSASGRWPSRRPSASSRSPRTGAWPTPTSACAASSACPATILDGTPWLERVADDDRQRVVEEFRRARALGHRASLDVRVEADIDRWARIHMAPVERRRGRRRPGSSARSRTSPSRSPHGWRSPRARPSTACWPSTPPTSCRATRSTAPSSTPPRWPARCWAGSPTRCSARPRADSASTIPRTPRSSIAIGSTRCAPTARAPRPTAPGAATARSCWLETTLRAVRAPRRRGAGDGVRLARHLRAQERRARARPPRTARRAHRAARTARCSSTASARRCAARAGASRGVAVVFLDLDRFKVVNDSLGHKAGDRLLVDVAMRLSSALRPSDTLARFGGDEMTLLCEDIEDAADARVIAQRLLDTFAEPFLVQDGEAFLQASLGVAVSRDGFEVARGPHPRRRRRDVPRQGSRPGRSRSSTRRCARTSTTALALEAALRRGIGRDELRLHCQPLVVARRRAHRGLRGARALGASRARPRAARVVHPAGRGDRAHRRRSAPGSCARRARRCGGSSTRPGWRPCRSRSTSPRASCSSPTSWPRCARRSRTTRSSPSSLVRRDHRERDHGDRGGGDPARAEGARRAPGDGRLRHRLLVAGASAPLPARRASRSTARSSPASATATARRSPARSSRWRTRWGCARWPRASRTRSSAAPCWRWAATSGRASSSRGRCRPTT